MTINEKTFEITTSQWDYNIPVHFQAHCNDEQGFRIGDKIIFLFNSDKIDNREYVVDNEEYEFNFALTENEANTVFSKRLITRDSISYSIKKKSIIDSEATPQKTSLLTLVDSRIIFLSTIKMEEENG